MNIIADGSLVFDTKIDEKGFNDGVKKLQSAGGKAFKAVGKAAVVATTAVAGIGAAAAKVGSDFEKGMSQVAATMGISAQAIREGDESFQALEKAAMDAGASTQFSATQASEALNYLALAGYDAEKSIKALPTVLNLAAAGGLELGYASDLVTDSMSALGMESEELEGFIDELAKTSQKSNTNVGQLGEAILTVGGTAKSLAGGTVELNTALGILADNGIKGAEGGTALRNVILALSAPTDKAASAMKDLGVEAFDAEGNMRPLNEVFEDLDSALAGMTEGQKTQVLNEIFNKVDLKSANALLSNSGERFDELSKYIENADGSASQMAETMNDNLQGQLTILGSNLETLGIQIYKGIEEPLKDVASSAIESVGQLSNAFEEGGFTGLVEEIGNVLANAISGIAEYAPMMLEAGVNMIMSFITGIRENLPAITESALSILQTLITSILEMLPEIISLGAELLISLITGIAEMLPSLTTQIIDTIIMVADTIIENLPLIIDAGIQLITALVEGIINNLPTLIEEVPRIINSFANALYAQLPLIIMTGIKIMIALIKGLIDSIPTLIKNIPQIIMAFVNVFTLYNWWNLGSSIMTKLKSGIDGMGGKILQAAVNIGRNIMNGIVNIIKSAPTWGRNMISNLIGALRGGISGIGSVARSLASSAMNAIKGAFSGAFNIGKNLVQGIWNGISNVKGWIMSKIKGFGSSIIGGIKGIFGIQSPSKIMRDEVGENLTLGIGVGLEKGMPDLQRDAEKELSGLTKKMKATVDFETSSIGTKIAAGTTGNKETSSVVNNNDNGVTQNVTIVNPERTPSENARQLRKVGRDLALGY